LIHMSALRSIMSRIIAPVTHPIKSSHPILSENLRHALH
jgi:hypothetical protein